MIAVIADDLSGAAELANAAVEAGFSAEVQIGKFMADGKGLNIESRWNRESPNIEHRRTEESSDVICVDAQTRSLKEMEAAAVVGEIARAVALGGPELVYKKCDSVLRGAVAAESLAIAGALGRQRVLLVPANPSRKRIIRGGEYFVDGVPLAETAFANDPEHPRRSSRVAELLGNAAGIETPDTVTPEDLERHAATVDANTLPAGGVDFFSALLRRQAGLKKGGAVHHQDTKAPREGEASSVLFVCGSNAAWLAGRGGEGTARGIPTFPMPAELFKRELREDVLTQWAADVAKGLRRRGAAMLAVGDGMPEFGNAAEMLADRLAQAVKLTLEAGAVARVFLEGGATASAVMRRLGLERFAVQKSPGPGVGALRPVGESGPLFLVKPGSYAWPESVWPGLG